ncbi:MAG: hypothetical protein ACYC35_15820 [Pirellulales bacterium]
MRYRLALVTLVVVAVGCKLPRSNNLPPAARLMHPGPGVDGPGPGVIPPEPVGMVAMPSSQIYFAGPDGMSITWDVGSPGQFDSEPLITPARSNFPQGAIYRLKLTNIPERAGVELYPTLEVGPMMPRTEAYLAHNAIPVQFTPEDFDQVLTGNFVTKVIYLPDAEFQELALAGVETLVSTRLDPGVDPIVEADRRGAILAIVRLGNKDLEIPGEGEIVNAGGGVMPAGYDGACPPGAPMPGLVTGAGGPQYGMPMSGTPIGLPGPPYVPLGVPAGLQKHVVKNHTRQHLPKPTEKVQIDVRQVPGYSYPKPANHVRIVERAAGRPVLFGKSLGTRQEEIVPDEECPEECVQE